MDEDPVQGTDAGEPPTTIPERPGSGKWFAIAIGVVAVLAIIAYIVATQGAQPVRTGLTSAAAVETTQLALSAQAII